LEYSAQQFTGEFAGLVGGCEFLAESRQCRIVLPHNHISPVKLPSYNLKSP